MGRQRNRSQMQERKNSPGKLDEISNREIIIKINNSIKKTWKP